MKKTKNKIFAGLILIISACGGKNQTADDGVYFQDFDNLHFWGHDEWNLTNEMAHSGDFSAKTDSNAEYSQTFEMDFKYAQSKGYKAMKVNAWIYVDNMNSKAGLVSSVESASGGAAYESADIKNFITAPKQWEKINVFLKFPEHAPDGSKIKVYLWSPNKSKIFLDDVTIKFEK